MGKGKRKKTLIDLNKGIKQCSKCRKIKTLDKFHKVKNHKSGYSSICKDCISKTQKKHRKKFLKNYQEYRKAYRKRINKSVPWKRFYKSAKARCNNPNANGYENYGGRGIKFLLTLDEVKNLWFECRAWEIKKPTLDRLDVNGDYIYQNCQFIEMSINSKITRRTLKVNQLDLKGNLINSWETFNDLLKEFRKSVRNEKIFLNYKWEIEHYGRKSKTIRRKISKP
jgi:hypothetical protein